MDIDSVLISNPRALLALPLLMKQLPDGLRGPIYATSAALLIAQQLVAEMSNATSAAANQSKAKCSAQHQTPLPGSALGEPTIANLVCFYSEPDSQLSVLPVGTHQNWADVEHPEFGVCYVLIQVS